ncbi:MAG: cytidylate kinase family protein, partial [Candidatus Thermoplasmatota archaeon]|nr:cytidylate kinase family protein [Candidatus Thermoplasmatota archaeon]
ILEDILKVEYIYAGRIFRDLAIELGLTLEEFGTLCEGDRSYDSSLDERMLKRAKLGDVLIEGRMIGPLCKKLGIPSFRIFINAESSIRSERMRERDGGEIEDVVKLMEEREASETKRYLNYYGIDPNDPSYYDLVIDSTSLSPEEEVALILEKLGER